MQRFTPEDFIRAGLLIQSVSISMKLCFPIETFFLIFKAPLFNILLNLKALFSILSSWREILKSQTHFIWLNLEILIIYLSTLCTFLVRNLFKWIFFKPLLKNFYLIKLHSVTLTTTFPDSILCTFSTGNFWIPWKTPQIQHPSYYFCCLPLTWKFSDGNLMLRC